MGSKKLMLQLERMREGCFNFLEPEKRKKKKEEWKEKTISVEKRLSPFLYNMIGQHYSPLIIKQF